MELRKELKYIDFLAQKVGRLVKERDRLLAIYNKSPTSENLEAWRTADTSVIFAYGNLSNCIDWFQIQCDGDEERWNEQVGTDSTRH
jgi:ABC-type uncharacterized transport system permease subunit